MPHYIEKIIVMHSDQPDFLIRSGHQYLMSFVERHAVLSVYL